MSGWVHGMSAIIGPDPPVPDPRHRPGPLQPGRGASGIVAGRWAALGYLDFSADLNPVKIRHRDAGHVWIVRKVLCYWRRRGSAPELLGEPGVVRCWRMEVWGPLPLATERRGWFIMLARGYGTRPFWELSPGPGQCACPPCRHRPGSQRDQRQ